MGCLCGLCLLPNHLLAVSLFVCRLEHKMGVVSCFWLALLTFAASQWPETVCSQDGPLSTQHSKRRRFSKEWVNLTIASACVSKGAFYMHLSRVDPLL